MLVERLTPDEILAFAAVADEVRASAYAWVVWGAALLIEGGAATTEVGAATETAGESWDFDDEDENGRHLPGSRRSSPDYP